MLLRISKYFFILLLSLISICLPNISTERNLMIFWDCDGDENLFLRLQHHSNLMGPVTLETLIALYQEPGAILISANILKNILIFGEFYRDFLAKDVKYLKDKYGRSDQFDDDENSIIDFSETCKYIDKNYNKLSELLENSATKEEFYKKIQDDPFFDLEKSKRFFDLEPITKYLMCAYFPFDRFIIKKLDSSGYLFIPYSYLKKIEINPTSLKENNGRVDETEIKLGLKINHLDSTKIDPKDILTFELIMPKDCRQSLVKFLDSIFVKKNDVHDLLLLKPWAIYWSSHGMHNPAFHETVKKLKSLQQERDLLTNQLDKLNKEYATNNDKVIGYITSKDRRQLENEIWTYKNNLRDIKFNMLPLRFAKPTLKSKVAGLTLKEFKKVLTFLNNKINTGFLFYTSCFAGGQQAIDAYKNETENKLSTFNYTIATDSSFDVPTRKEIISSSLGSYFNSNDHSFDQIKLDEMIDFNEKRVILHSNFNYPNFFNQLEKFPIRSSSYLELFANINPLLTDFKTRLRNKEWIQALPSIRFPGTTWFITVELPRSIVQLTKVKALARGSQPLIIDQNIHEKYAVLLYTKDIPFEIVVKSTPKKLFPSIVSMNPGIAIHILESLDASEFDLSQILSSFFPFQEFTGSKLFLIKNLKITGNGKFNTTEGELATIQDVTIVYNGKLGENDSFNNFVFFTGPSNKIWNYTWRAGSPLPVKIDSHLRISQNKNYKDEFLKYFSARESDLLTQGKFSGIVETSDGQENVDIDEVKKLLEKRAKQLQELFLKNQNMQLQVLVQSLTNLESQFFRIKH